MVREISYKATCDMLGCKNEAKYCLFTKKRFSPKIHFCESCKKRLYEELGKSIVPRSLDAPYSPKRLSKF